MTAQPLHLRLLGGFSLFSGDRPLTSLGSSRLQSLLAYLVLHRDAPQPRQHLAFLLYPDSSETQARTNLRNLLHLLRQALPEPDRFVSGDTLSLQWRDDAPFTLDVLEFECAVEQAGALKMLQRAADLYRGDLLPSCYDDWILPERERLRQAFLRALDLLIGKLAEARDYPAAIACARRLLQHDPLSEGTYRALMKFSAESGDRAGVVHFYNTCVATLQRELGVLPSAETSATFEQLAHDLSTPRAARPVAPSRATLNNLPLYLSQFVGREREKEEIKQLIHNHRLVTLIGAGGVGKTRLGVAVTAELLDDFCDGIWVIDLAPLSDPALLAQTVATVLAVRESPKRALLETLVDSLRARQILLILDNCEHLTRAARGFAQTVLQAAHKARILATSRQVLGIVGERIYRVPPLCVPDLRQKDLAAHERDLAELAENESVQLFVDRAALALPTFVLTAENAPALAQICRRLDGIPLAVELAAARVPLLSTREIAERLDDAFQLLARGSATELPHHQTLRAAMDWSYETLSEPEQALLRRLAVFAGGFTLEAVEAICGETATEPAGGTSGTTLLDVLSDLVDKSLVSLESQEGSRRTYLLETVRQYAREKLLESGEALCLAARHLEYYAEFAEKAEPHLDHSEQKRWLDRLELEHDNLRAALNSSRSDKRLVELGLRLAGALTRFWEINGYLTEGRVRLDEHLGKECTSRPARAKAVSGMGTLTWLQGDYARAAVYHDEALALYREEGDKVGVAFSLNNLGVQAGNLGELERAEALLKESLAVAREAGDNHLVGMALANLAEAERIREHVPAASELFQASLDLFEAAGDKYGSCFPSNSLGLIAYLRGDTREAAQRFKQSLAIACELESKLSTAEALEGLARVAGARDRWLDAARLFGAAIALRQVIGAPGSMADQIDYEHNLASLRARLGESRFKAALLEGNAMAPEETIQYALKVCG